MYSFVLDGVTTDVMNQITKGVMEANADFSKGYFTSPAFYLSLLAIAIFIVAWIFLNKGKKKLIETTTVKYPNESERIMFIRVTTIILKIICIVAVIATILGFHGIRISIFMLLLLFFIIVCTLAGQDALKDCIAGTLIFVNRYFTIGDVIKYDNVEGKVIKMTLFVTRVQDLLTEDIITVSNRMISSARVISHFTAINIGLPYDLPANQAHQALKETCEEIKKIDGIEDCIYRGTNDFGDSAILYQIGIYTAPEKKYALRRAALMKIQDGLDKAGIAIPLQQLEVHIK
ncbi:MAG: mechanosensitive ion channel family protein [Lachnospiraceae bacterium]|nr:mechanosensitive ion channel family protein [Lachnospiraceae bacterium]